MRLTKAATTGLVILAVLLTAGTGFAAFTSGAYIPITVSSGTLGPLVWGSSPTNSSYAPNDVCTAVRGTTTNPGDTLILTATGLLPGDFCTFGDTLRNLGTIPAKTTSEISGDPIGGLCAVLTYSDSFFSPSTIVGTGGQSGSVSHTIPAGHTINWAGTIQLPSNTPSNYAGDGCSFVVTLTGSAGT
jgi:hypothetical protein